MSRYVSLLGLCTERTERTHIKKPRSAHLAIRKYAPPGTAFWLAQNTMAAKSTRPLLVTTNPDGEPTVNGKGLQYSKKSTVYDVWISSLPDSALPLLDVGACYGVHTLLALSDGRDVIALDSADDHLKELRRRVAEQSARLDITIWKKCGKLVSCIRAELPDRHALPKASVSGILIAEVLHFLKPGEPLEVFNHAYDWLCDGGLLAVTVSGLTYTMVETLARVGTFREQRTNEQLMELVKRKTGEELLTLAPGVVQVQKEALKETGFFDRNDSVMFSSMYLLSTQELETMAKLSGFEVLDCRNCSQERYTPPNANESCLLIARKPG